MQSYLGKCPNRMEEGPTAIPNGLQLAHYRDIRQESLSRSQKDLEKTLQPGGAPKGAQLP